MLIRSRHFFTFSPSHFSTCLAHTLALLLLSSLSFAQSTEATLSGTVEDAQGAVVPGVKVTITNPSTGFERIVTTDGSGSFTIPLLQPGTYELLFERDGFTRVQVPNITLNVNDRKALQVQLKVGSVQAAIDVRADSGLIEETPAVATVIDRQFASNLPLNGRSLQSLISLAPGVVLVSTTLQGGQFSVNGQRSNANYFTVDGVSANVGVDPRVSSSFREGASGFFAGTLPGLTTFGGTNNMVSVDALEEFKIQTSTYAAEFGRQPGGQVQLSTRSGKNAFHGSGYEYVRNEIFDANNWFTNSRPLTADQIAAGLTTAPRPPLRQNQFGGTFSGPVVLPGFGEGGKKYWSGRNKAFFFFSYEGLRLLLPKSGTGFVPSLRLRQIAAPSVRPLLNAFPLPTGPEALSATGQPLGYSPIAYAFSNPQDLDVWSVRFDYNIRDNISIFGRYNNSSSSNSERLGSNTLSYVNSTTAADRTLTLGSTWVIAPKLTNEFKINYAQSRGTVSNRPDDFGGATPVDPASLITG